MATYSGILFNTPITVDNFSKRPGIQHFFLTHFHADHYNGLTKDFDRGIIYCTEITRSLIISKIKVEPDRIVPFRTKTPYNISLGENVNVNVTFIDANHCPGSVMILFEGYFGRYLHTGDFRGSDKLCEEIGSLINKKGPLDRLFLDTTFLDPFWTVFPSPEDSINQVISLIKQYPSDTQVYLECSMLGTERVLSVVARTFNTLIHVDKAKYKELKTIFEILAPSEPFFFTLENTQTRFHCVRQQSFTTNINKMPEKVLTSLNAERIKNVGTISNNNNNNNTNVVDNKVLCIKPSTQWFGGEGRGRVKNHLKKPYKVDGVWHVLYSIHSSYSEIIQFVKRISPRSITPITKDITKEMVLRHFGELMDPSPSPAVHVPSSFRQSLIYMENVELTQQTKKVVGRKPNVLVPDSDSDTEPMGGSDVIKSIDCLVEQEISKSNPKQSELIVQKRTIEKVIVHDSLSTTDDDLSSQSQSIWDSQSQNEDEFLFITQYKKKKIMKLSDILDCDDDTKDK